MRDPNQLPEIEIQQQILLILGARRDVRLFRRNVGAAKNASGRVVRFGLPGQADLWGWVQPEGWHLEIEVKSATGKLNPAQERWRAACQYAGVIHIVARSVLDAEQQLNGALAIRRASR